MGKEQFLKLFAECVKDGTISFEYYKADYFLGSEGLSHDFDKVVILVNSEVVKEIELY